MKKVVCLLVFCGLCRALWAQDDAKDAESNLHASLSQVKISTGVDYFDSGFSVYGGPCYVLGEIEIVQIPFWWGVDFKIVFDYFDEKSKIWWEPGVLPALTLHWNLDFTDELRIGFTTGAGPMIKYLPNDLSNDPGGKTKGSSGNIFDKAPGRSGGLDEWGIAFAIYGSLAWRFSDMYAVVFRGSLVNSTFAGGFGVEFVI